jgi:3-methyladenine DNA glycosylase AlkD
MTLNDIVAELRAHGSARNRAGQANFGINVDTVLGVSVPDIRKLAKRVGRDHALAQELWDTGIHEARHLAAMVDEPSKVTKAQMQRWARSFNSWDLVDGCCSNLFCRTPHAFDMAIRWSSAKPEYTKRAGFALMAYLAHANRATDATLRSFLPIIELEANDDRPYVRKAVNWALRDIGKRNTSLNASAIKTAERIKALNTRPARWIASDALRELRSDAVQARLAARA